MTDKQTIFLTWFIIFAVALMSMVAIQGHITAIDIPAEVECEGHAEQSTYDILNTHNFYNWTEHDKELLTQMMQVTAASALGIETELSFGELASTAPVHVLETYIDLLESVGY